MGTHEIHVEMDLAEQEIKAGLASTAPVKSEEPRSSSDKQSSSRDRERRSSRDRGHSKDRSRDSRRRSHRSSDDRDSRRSSSRRERGSSRERSSRSDRDRSDRDRSSRDRGYRERKRELSPGALRREERRKKRANKTGWDQAPDPNNPVPIPGLPMMNANMSFGNIPMQNIQNIMMHQQNPMLHQMMQTQANPNIERQRRRLYVGNIPPNLTEMDVRYFFNNLIRQKLPDLAAGDPIMDVTVDNGKSFAFIELRHRDEATTVIAFDGIDWNGYALKLRRPKDYVPPAEGEGEVRHIDGVIGTNVPDTENKLFIGGLPMALGDGDVRDLLQTIGPLSSFNLVKDSSTNNSKGFAFCEYVNGPDTDRAIAALHQMPMGDKTLMVQRALAGAGKLPGDAGESLFPQLSAESFPIVKPGDYIDKDMPPGVFLAPQPLPVLLKAIPFAGVTDDSFGAVPLNSAMTGNMSAVNALGMVPAGGAPSNDKAREAAARLALAIAKKSGTAPSADVLATLQLQPQSSTPTESAVKEEPKEEAKDEDKVKQESDVKTESNENTAEPQPEQDTNDNDAVKSEHDDNQETDVKTEAKVEDADQVDYSKPFDPMTSDKATRVVMILNMVAPEELVNDEEYYCLKADVLEQMQTYGEVIQVSIPRRVEPDVNEDVKPAPPGTGRVYVEFKNENDARKAVVDVGGRIFDGRSLITTFYDEGKFANNDLGPAPISAKIFLETQRRFGVTTQTATGQMLRY